MNKSGNENRSVRNTKKKLRDGLMQLLSEKPVNEISVKDLTELADVNRGTFYFHYSDVYDMLRKIEDDFFTQFDHILEGFPPAATGNPIYPYLVAIFAFLGENHDFCRILLGQNGDIQFVNRVKQLVDDKCSYFWRQFVPDANAKRFEMYNAFIINGCVGLIQNWLDGGLRESPEDISQLAGTIILASIKPCISS